WAAGEIVRGVQRLRVPADVPGGPARLLLSVTPSSTPAAEIATVDLRVPARSFAVPRMGQVLNADLGGRVRLLGYDQDAAGVTLYWQAVQAMDTSYVVFVHALDGTG